MRLQVRSLAAMLMVLAFAAFQPDSQAQSRSERSKSTSRSSSASRSSSTSSSKSTYKRGSSSSASGRPSGTSSTKPSASYRPDISPADRNPSRPTKPSQSKPTKPSKPTYKPGNSHRPANHYKPMPVYRPGRHVAPVKAKPRKHHYGYQTKSLPLHAVRHYHRGVTYYCHKNIWYRPYGGHYVVCRPPFGTVLAANLIADMAWTAVRLSYYSTVANTFSQINENNQYIAQQNAIIAQNNATIASQNQTIAQMQPTAYAAYSLANELGLVQSYAAADASYFYQDGVFYAMDSNGQYIVIVPPAGALVEILPADYEVVVLGGKEYYKVDDTVYRTVISEGKPYFEVVGQM